MLNDFEWVYKFPKVELHAHLFASTTPKQLIELLRERGMHENAEEFETMSSKLDIDTIFKKAFSYMGKIIKTLSDFRRIIDLAIENFISDNVCYLELRSGPKQFADSGFREYFETIIERIKHFEDKITVRYIVSVNREMQPSLYDNLVETVMAVTEYRKYIVGFDFSGDPRKNSFRDFRRIFEKARACGFKVTLHSPEIPKSEKDLDEILDFRPERIGHFVFYTEKQLKKIIDEKIPIEICPTSNLVLKNYAYHNFNELLKAGVTKYSISTDDWLIFNKSLSQEILIFQEGSKMSKENLILVLKNMVEFIFDDASKPRLRETIAKFLDKNQQ